MRGVVRLLGAAILIVLLGACDGGFFPSVDEGTDTELRTVPAGSLVEPAQSIPVEISYGSNDVERASAMSVQVLNADGELVQEKEYTATELTTGEIPPLVLDDLEDGVYFLEVEAWRNGELLFRESRQVFITSRTPEIRSVSLYPSRLSRGAEALGVAEVLVDESHRAYLRWRMAGIVVAEGYLEDGLDRAVFPGRKDPGVYGVQLEVFPWGPDEGVRTEKGTALVQSGDIVIRQESAGGAGSEPESPYLLRYTFAGHLKPDGGAEEYAIQRDGEVVLDMVDGNFGYRVSSPGTMNVPVSAFSAYTDGAVRLVFSLIALEETSGEILRIEPDTSGLPRARLTREEEGRWVVLRIGTEAVSYEWPRDERAAEIYLTFARHERTLLAGLRVNDGPSRFVEIVGVDPGRERALPSSSGPTDGSDRGDDRTASESDWEEQTGEEARDTAEDPDRSDAAADETQSDRRDPHIELVPGRIILGGDTSLAMLVKSLRIRELDMRVTDEIESFGSLLKRDGDQSE